LILLIRSKALEVRKSQIGGIEGGNGGEPSELKRNIKCNVSGTARYISCKRDPGSVGKGQGGPQFKREKGDHTHGGTQY